jgi:four helix bundle protein
VAEGGGWQSIEDMEMFQRLEKLCDAVWDEVVQWHELGKRTVGTQLIRATDSMGSNHSEGDGRFHHKDKLNFCYIARGSCKEAAFWVRRAESRKLIATDRVRFFLSEINAVKLCINTVIKLRRQWMGEVREATEEYEA